MAFWRALGANLAPKWRQVGGQVGAKLAPKSEKKGSQDDVKKDTKKIPENGSATASRRIQEEVHVVP